MVQTTLLSVGGMSCGACVRHVTGALDGMTGVVHVDVDLQNQQATVEHVPDWVDESSLIAAINHAGYQAKVTAGGIQGDDVSRTASGGCSSGCGCRP